MVGSVADEAAVGGGDRAGGGAVDEQPVHRGEEVVAGGPADEPPVGEALVADEDLLSAAPTAGAPRLRRVALSATRAVVLEQGGRAGVGQLRVRARAT